MKRLFFCLVALIAVFALVMPTYAAEMKVNGMWFARAYARDNYDGDDDRDDSVQYVTQRMRTYWNFIASENLRLVYKNEIDFEWGDAAGVDARGDGGGRAGDSVNLETKNVYLQFMVPDTPVRATIGLQGISSHKGWFHSDDYSAARFDMNFDPVNITAYWAGLGGLFNLQANDSNKPDPIEDTDSSNDNWVIVGSGAYKAENMDASLSFAYERKANDTTTLDQPESNDLFLVMGEFNMSFDMVSFFVIAGKNFGEADGSGADSAKNRNYDGFMFDAGVSAALDMATIHGRFIYASGDKEGDFDDDFQGLNGQTFSWAELFSDGFYTGDRNPANRQIGGSNHPSNMYAINAGADFKPTDTTLIKLNAYYIGMVEDRTVAGSKEDEIGIEIDARLTQKIYDNLSLTVLGAYLLAEDGYGFYNGDPAAGASQADNSGDDAFQVGIGLDFKF